MRDRWRVRGNRLDTFQRIGVARGRFLTATAGLFPRSLVNPSPSDRKARILNEVLPVTYVGPKANAFIPGPKAEESEVLQGERYVTGSAGQPTKSPRARRFSSSLRTWW